MQPNVRVWRPAMTNAPVCMEGFTTGYSIDPVGEVVIGIIESGGMVGRRGRRRSLFEPGDLCVWDASGNHSGAPAAGSGWWARLVMFDAPTFDELSEDPDSVPQIKALPGERVVDGRLARQFVHMHDTLRTAESALEADVAVIEFLHALSGGRTDNAVRKPLQEPALRRACELLADAPERNVNLTELSDVAGISRHQLTRMFRSAFGVPPHRYQLAQRVLRSEPPSPAFRARDRDAASPVRALGALKHTRRRHRASLDSLAYEVCPYKTEPCASPNDWRNRR